MVGTPGYPVHAAIWQAPNQELTPVKVVKRLVKMREPLARRLERPVQLAQARKALSRYASTAPWSTRE
jgi:hypothetical protein